MSVVTGDRPAARPGSSRGAVLFFKYFWLAGNVAVVLVFLAIVYGLFGPGTSASFLLGIVLSLVIVTLLWLGKRFAEALWQWIRNLW